LAARRDLQALLVHAGQRRRRQALQQGHAAPQAFGEFQFAAHGRFGDRRHLRFQALHVGDLVDAFDRDQGRVHVHRDQAEVGQRQVGVDEAGVDAGREGRRIDGQFQFGREVDAVAAQRVLVDRGGGGGCSQSGDARQGFLAGARTLEDEFLGHGLKRVVV
jgi:hypothetical protein